ncbi:MAG: DUF2339 domain-containing protein [Pseudomonadota bacterium]
MEALFVLLAVVVVAIPIAVIYLLVARAGMARRIAELETHVARLMADGPAAAAPVAEREPTKPKTKPEPAAARVVAVRKAADPTPAKVAAAEEPQALSRLVGWLGLNWFYVVSALSLALAGLFLVQYGIENALFPPGARVLAALGFGGALIAGGEVIRRRFGDTPDAATAYLPSVFSGAGLVSLFGGVAAARLLYDLVGVEGAFAGMAAVGLLGVVLGWMHGPLLATVGVVGAFAAPLLVGSTVPATPWLYLYFGVVAAVGLGIDTVRRWAWVSALSVGLGFGMGWLTVNAGGADMTLGFQAHVIALAFLAIVIPARSFMPDHGGVLIATWARHVTGPRPGFPTMLAGAAVGLAVAGLAWTSTIGAEPFWMAVLSLVMLTLALIFWSVSAPALQDIALLPVLAIGAVIWIEGASGGPVITSFAAAYADTPEAEFPMAVSVLFGIGLLLSVTAAGRALRAGHGVAWAIGGALAAPVLAVCLDVAWGPARTIGAYAWALHAITMAALMVALALRFARVDGNNRVRTSVFVLSALASITFALVLILSLAALTVALAVTVAVAAALDRRFDLPLMQVFVSVGVVTVGARLIGDPGLVWALDAPLWEVLLAYGGTLGAFCTGLWMLRTKARAPAQIMLDTAAWSSGGILVTLLLFRALEGALGQDGTFSHWGFGLYAAIWLGLMLVQLIRAQRMGGWLAWVRFGLAGVFGLIAGFAIVIGVTLVSPLLTGWGADVAGPAVLNTLLVAYLLPAGVLGLGALQLRGRVLRYGLGGAGVLLASHWGFAALRHVWQGAETLLLDNGFLQPELYSYTVALLIAGALLFYQSLARRNAQLRRAGLVVIAAAVAKVFLIDISDLDGLMRVLSLVVLGLSLAGLAWLNRWAQQRDGDQTAQGTGPGV